jgi:hypothetical protein
MIRMGKENPDKPGKPLPTQHIVVKADSGKRKPLFFVSNVIEQVFKGALVFGGINDDSPFWQGFERINLGGIQRNMGEKRFEQEREKRKHSPVFRETTSIVLVVSTQKTVDPFSDSPSAPALGSHVFHPKRR